MNPKKSTFGLIFFTKKANENGECRIYSRITINGKSVDLSTKRIVNKILWNSAKGTARGTSKESLEVNDYLEQFRSGVVDAYQEAIIQQKPLTPENIRNTFLGQDEAAHTFQDLFNYHNEYEKQVLAKGTMKNYYTTQDYILQFLKKSKKPAGWDITQLSYKFIADFELFLRTFKKKDDPQPLNNNGVMKHLERFKKMINMAVTIEWLDKDPFVKHKLKFTSKERGYLTEEELAVVETKELKTDKLIYVRDLFLFGCYTGLSYIDAINLTANNLMIGIDKEHWLLTQRQKSSKPVKLPLLPLAAQIIARHRHDPRAISNGTIFRPISNQKLNDYLKDLARECGIDKNFSFHLARHTFATTVTLANGVPIETVSKMLGHTKISTTQIYAKVVERKVSDDMKILREKLNNKTQDDNGQIAINN
ncbi:site-specific integrase [Mucilaginibacter paludis]|uniref:Integrase family protein n=1 Tax=Mucilaginibacter paludis DSM 18603 TaxID=714943 RepID=H1YH96_9SPHI|nr:site-specific integrase [Mucilaginibacter paludis]EHQ24598.1 integrase family protein [Mucilaginibacter paludis DSM 18603]